MPNNEWYTPNTTSQPVIDLVLKVLGDIDLDPAADSSKRIPAGKHYTAADDGLKLPWNAPRVFLNPPYDKPLQWLQKLDTEMTQGNVGEAIVLLKAGTVSNKGTGALLSKAQAFAWWRGRLHFIPQNPREHSRPDFDTVIVYYGHNTKTFEDVFSPYCHKIRK